MITGIIKPKESNFQQNHKIDENLNINYSDILCKCLPKPNYCCACDHDLRNLHITNNTNVICDIHRYLIFLCHRDKITLLTFISLNRTHYNIDILKAQI